MALFTLSIDIDLVSHNPYSCALQTLVQSRVNSSRRKILNGPAVQTNKMVMMGREWRNQLITDHSVVEQHRLHDCHSQKLFQCSINSGLIHAVLSHHAD